MTIWQKFAVTWFLFGTLNADNGYS